MEMPAPAALMIAAFPIAQRIVREMTPLNQNAALMILKARLVEKGFIIAPADEPALDRVVTMVETAL